MPNIDDLRKMVWNARWVWGPGPGDAVLGPGPNPHPFSMLYFRRTFDVTSTRTAELVVHLSADSRYRFYFNGEYVGRGPARSDLDHYNFETHDLSALLRTGRNVLAVQVMHYGQNGPIAEMHDPHGAMVLQGTLQTTSGETVLDTDGRWLCRVDEAYEPHYCYPGGAFFINPFEEFHGTAFPWGWTSVDYDDSAWPPVLMLPRASGRNQLGHPRHRWRLVPREIAHLTEEPVVPEAVIRGDRTDDLLALATGQGGVVEIPADTEADWTIYMGKLFTGYPRITTSGGAGARIELSYAEALSKNHERKRRDDFSWGSVEEFCPSDIICPGGGEAETWEPMWYRCGRYLRLRVKTDGEPLRLTALGFNFSSYPFRQEARFDSNDADLTTIWDVSWHTALCCAHEHYEDCPYWEQLQYISDTRLQMLISYYVAGDDTLARQALRAFDRSLLPEGLTQSRYPSNLEQIIPTFSLMFVMTVEDHWQCYGDLEFTRSVARGIGPIMHWFERRMTPDGLVGFIPWWVFVDWRPEAFREGIPPESETGASTTVNLMYVGALDSGARIYRAVGDPHHAAIWEKRAEAMREAIRRTCWSEKEGLFVDGPGSTNLSQHSNVWAILTDTATPEQTERIMKRLMSDSRLVQTTYIFDYYLFQALLKVGAIEELETVIGRWRKMVDYGFSTFPETPEPARSDCHAWSAWPMFEFLRTILGVMPGEPGYGSLVISPKPFGKLDRASGSVPTLRGEVKVAWRREGKRFGLRASIPTGLATRIELPDGRIVDAPTGGDVTAGDKELAAKAML